MIVMCAGYIFFAWITVRMTSLITHKECLEVRFEQKMDELNGFLEARQIPLKLRQKIKSYYSMRYPTMRVS